MSERIRELRAVLEKTVGNLERLHGLLDGVYSEELVTIGKTERSALMVVGLLENWYTCLETALFRISQAFENHLSDARWHHDLLERMTLNIEGVRIAAVSDFSYPRLLELLKFRHFRRYYFEVDFDWDRLDFLRKKLDEAYPVVLADLKKFIAFLDEVIDG